MVDGQQFQVKCLEDIGGPNEHFGEFPEIPIFANSELANSVQASDQFWKDMVYFVEGFDREKTNIIMESAIAAGASINDLDLPAFAIAVSAARNVHAWWKGEVPLLHLPFEFVVDGTIKGGLSAAGGFAGSLVGLLLFGPAAAPGLSSVPAMQGTCLTGPPTRIEIGIAKSVYIPLMVPQVIEEFFNQILAIAETINDPFEQAFFTLVQSPHLQPLEDVNDRVSRLAANVPLIKMNLSPLSFKVVSVTTYTEAILGVYEMNRIDLLKDVFIWAYERSALRYAAVRLSLGKPDPFRLKHREALREIIQTISIERLGRRTAISHIADWSEANIEAEKREQFSEVTETEILALYEGNFARYRISPLQFKAWQAA